MKTYLIDSSLDPFGHNVVYLEALLNVQDTIKTDYFIPSIINSNVLGIIRHKYKSFSKLLSLVPKNSIAHFLYGDLFYIVPYLKKLETQERRILATMHYFPQQKAKQTLLKNFCNKLSGVIVHSEFIQQQYLELGIKNVFLVNYPSFYNYSVIENKQELRKKFSIPDTQSIIISALGGTRYDKGLDILMESFQFIPEKTKSKILLNIVGRPEYFDASFILSQIEKFHIQSRLVLRGVSDIEFMENVRLTDIMALPYRKTFSGNSGPMTEAIVNEIPLIVPEFCNLSKIVKKQNFGLCFIPEDPEDLAKKITDCCENDHTFNFTKNESLSVQEFIKKHTEIYSMISSKK